MADKVREYSIVINGLTKGLRDTQSLTEAIEKLEAASQSLDETQQKGATATKSRTAAMTDEEKAAQRLEATRRKLAAVDSEQAKEQARLNQQLKERQREVARQIQIESLEEGSLERLRLEAAALNDVNPIEMRHPVRDHNHVYVAACEHAAAVLHHCRRFAAIHQGIVPLMLRHQRIPGHLIVAHM